MHIRGTFDPKVPNFKREGATNILSHLRRTSRCAFVQVGRLDVLYWLSISSHFLLSWLDTMASGVSGFHAVFHRSASAPWRINAAAGLSKNEARIMSYPLYCEFLSDPLHVPGKFPSL